MYRHLPNQLTLLRLLLAAIFFIVLNQYRFRSGTPNLILPIATGVFLAAALTDLMDGYLARRWRVESTFGRIMDPLCDKVLIIGAFMYLAGPRFVIPHEVQERALLVMATGVYPWMVAVILARELLVTSVRGEMEGAGVRFGAAVTGKAKMALQSLAIPLILMAVYLLDRPRRPPMWLQWVPDGLAYLTVLITASSGLPYLIRAFQAMRIDREDG